jgi:hypothetical protein
MNNQQANSSGSPESFRELLTQIGNTVLALIHDQIELVKKEIRENLAGVQSGILTLALSCVVGMLALLPLFAAAVVGLGFFIGIAVSAFIIGLGLALVGGILVFAGVRRLKKANLKPKETVRSLKEGKEWLKKEMA